MKTYISIIIVLIATGTLLSANKLVKNWRISLSDNAYIDYQIKYQVLL